MALDERSVTVLATGGWPVPVVGAACLVAGVGLGWVYFRMLRVTAAILVGGRRSLALALTVSRLGVLVAGLYAASRLGALPLLATVVGVLVARHSALRAVVGSRA